MATFHPPATHFDELLDPPDAGALDVAHDAGRQHAPIGLRKSPIKSHDMRASIADDCGRKHGAVCARKFAKSFEFKLEKKSETIR